MDLEKKDYFKLVNEFWQFPYYLSMEKGMALYLNKRNFPSPKDAVCNCFVEIGLVVLFFNFLNLFLLFCNYLPMEKGVAHLFHELKFPLPKNALCQVLLKLAQWFWRRIFLDLSNVFFTFSLLSPH